MYLLSFTTDLTDWTDGTDTGPVRAIRQKQQKPLAVDARCLLRAIDAVAARKSLSKLRHFLPPTSSPLQGLCIYRKAINKNKHLSSHRPAKVSSLKG